MDYYFKMGLLLLLLSLIGTGITGGYSHSSCFIVGAIILFALSLENNQR